MTTVTGYCFSPSCSRIGERALGGLCLMHAVSRGQVVTCGKCSQPWAIVDHFPGIACGCDPRTVQD